MNTCESCDRFTPNRLKLVKGIEFAHDGYCFIKGWLCGEVGGVPRNNPACRMYISKKGGAGNE